MNYEDIKKLMDDMGDSKIDSLDIEFPDGIKISMKKDTGNVMSQKMVEMPAQQQITVNTANMPVANECEKVVDNTNVIKSPMVGTFYNSPSPKDDPFVKVGDKVKKGQVLCVVEAMKLMNEIESEFDGEITQICVNNEDMVEYGMPLFRIK